MIITEEWSNVKYPSFMWAFSTTTLVMSARMEQHDTHHTDFRKKSVETFALGFKSRKK